MSPVAFAGLSHITNLINSIASGSLLQVQSFFDVVVGLSFFNLSLKYMYLFMAVLLGLHCFAWAFSSHREQGYSSLGCTGFSLQWFLQWNTGLMLAGFRSCGSQALEHRLSNCGARA